MSQWLRGASIVDGSGAPAFAGDVLIEAGRIARVGELSPSDTRGAEEIDCSGLVVCPGFIDIHTHFDAQVFWDPDLTPSSWHGVTTAVMGNCGFGLAPTRPGDRGTIVRVLENVEGMPLRALEQGIRWDFETFPEYLAALRRLPLRINLAAYIGHTPVRQYVMGDDATEREAREEEIAQMCRIVGEAMDAGAIGFSTSHAASHVGAYGKPVASRLASIHEIHALAGELGKRDRGLIEATWGPDLFVDEFAALARAVGRPVSWAAIMATRRDPNYAPDVIQRTHAAGGAVHPQIAVRAIGVQIRLSEPGPFANVPAFVEVLALPKDGREGRYRDAEWRRNAERQIDDAWGDIVARGRVSESTLHAGLVNGPSLGALAQDQGTSAFALMIDLALEESLATRFHIPMTNDDEAQVGRMLQDDGLLLGLSDAGAHTSQLCDADAPTYLLQTWWRERQVLSLEKAIWRLTGHPAEIFGLRGRGRVAPGAIADLLAINPDTVGTTGPERIFDLPDGADRIIARSQGIEHIWVGGTATRRNGADLTTHGAGQVLAPG
jgi:N-acyl-D-aspartate/D-glutamate deacylase